jgi:hypothetical protein
VIRIALGLALVGCSAPVRLQVIRANDYLAGEVPEVAGTCPATITIRVVDGQRAPVAGASVTSHQRQSMTMPSMVPTYEVYETTAVITDTDGKATVCRPDRVAPDTGDWFMSRDAGHVEARLGERSARLDAPFDDAIILRVP